jgi:hypothetical protein
MLIQYIHAALERAKYEIIAKDLIMEKFPNLRVYGLQARHLKNVVETWKKSLMNG